MRKLPKQFLRLFYQLKHCLTVGRGQVVRQRLLVPPFAGSNPAAPAKGILTEIDRTAMQRSFFVVVWVVRTNLSF